MECRSAGCSIRQFELSSDHDPLYRFHQWQANLRILEITEIKAIPYAPLSHPFVERDRHDSAGVSGPDAVLDDSGLERKLLDFQHYYNGHREHAGLSGKLPEPDVDRSMAKLGSYRWQKHCGGLFQTPTAA
jgi:hypothetical protein